jgi:hypothetical protein
MNFAELQDTAKFIIQAVAVLFVVVVAWVTLRNGR